MSTATNVLFPVGRLVMGSLYKAQDKDAAGAPLVIKTGPNAGKPTTKYFFALAIPKTPGHTHWAQTSWGKLIWEVAHAAFPQGQANSPGFAFKIEDGDSAAPNKRGRKPVETEGFAGCWVVSFSSTFAPKLFQLPGPTPLLEPDAIKLGYYIEVYGAVAGNDNAQNPGVYINHQMVALRGYGKEITRGPDAAAVGFGGGALPQGASAVPSGQALTPPVPTAPMASVPPPAIVAPPGPAAVTPPPTPVVPHPGFMVPPPAGSAPPPPPAAPTWKGPPGTSQAQYAEVGWTVDQMRAQGLLA